MVQETYYIKAQAAGGGGGGGSVGATLMKTGQTVSYRTGDDGDIEAGRATDFLTLASNNPFGNTNRFTDELGGQTYTNNIVIDWSTYNGTDVLGYSRVNQQATWDDAIDNCLAYSSGSYSSGWRLANAKEMINIYNYQSYNVLNYSPFNFTASFFYTSTAVPGQSTRILWGRNSDGQLQNYTKTGTFNYIPVRNFTVSGTTLT
jgi:hypothetical protein